MNAFNTLIHQEGVSVILGPASSSETRVAFPIAPRKPSCRNQPDIRGRGLSAIGDFVFRIPLTTGVVIPKGVAATQAKLGYQRVATMYDETDLFSTDRDAALQETFAATVLKCLPRRPSGAVTPTSRRN